MLNYHIFIFYRIKAPIIYNGANTLSIFFNHPNSRRCTKDNYIKSLLAHKGEGIDYTLLFR